MQAPETPRDALKEAIDFCGGQAALAASLGLRQQHIWNWLNRDGSAIPAQYCPSIERVTGVRCERLRPDVDWKVLRQGRAKTKRGPQRRALKDRRVATEDRRKAD